MFHGNIAAALTSSRRFIGRARLERKRQVREFLAITLHVGAMARNDDGGNKWILVKPRLLATVTREDGL